MATQVEAQIAATLNPDGSPRDPKKILIGIQNAVLARINFQCGQLVSIPVRSWNQFENMRGVVLSVHIFPHGRVVHLEPVPGGLLGTDTYGWRRAFIWVATRGGSGMLY